MKVRIKYSKQGEMKFIGHLDLLRYFQKLMRRADIPIAYSEGFNPHQKMSFGAPLGIGLTSDGEYCDIELEGVISSADALAALNANSVKNITVTSFKELPNDAKNAMAAAAASDYDIFIAKDKYNIEEKKIISAFYEFISQNEIIVLKKSKRKEEKTDILPFIYGYRISCDDSGINIYLNLCAGSVNNIKPELVLESFFQYLGFDRGSEHIRSFAKINRIDAYCNIEGKFVSLGDIGSDIK